MGFRKTFTDYLDDVSTTYVDELVLAANRGQKAANIAYRGDEVPGGSSTYPAGGTQRGNPKTKEVVLFYRYNFQDTTYTQKKRNMNSGLILKNQESQDWVP